MGQEGGRGRRGLAAGVHALVQGGHDVVLEIDVPDEEIIVRMSGRRVHPRSGRTYHVKFHPPRREGHDDQSGEPLVQREDDREETVRKRLEVYRAQTRPLIDYYRAWAATGDARAPRYRRISGVGSVGEITARALSALERVPSSR